MKHLHSILQDCKRLILLTSYPMYFKRTTKKTYACIWKKTVPLQFAGASLHLQEK